MPETPPRPPSGPARGRLRGRPLRLIPLCWLPLVLQGCGDPESTEVLAAEQEAPIEIPEGMEGWAHLRTHNAPGTIATNGLNKVDEGGVTLWHKNGVKRGEGRIDADGKKTGPWTFWFENGMKRWEGRYEADRVVGRERAWYDDGAPHFEGTYVDGKRQGLWSYWHPNGRRMWKGHYEGGKRHGRYVEWTVHGDVELEASGIYELGRKVSGYVPVEETEYESAEEALGAPRVEARPPTRDPDARDPDQPRR